ncbi:MAG: fibronectin type III domain-containing protein [Clostridia bacterium]|nr:fibronectin type III domain-containing protein [Clostridia bacterium]
MTVKWTKIGSNFVSGYQIQYSTSSEFKNAKKVTVKGASTVSKKITKLKANTKYYVRVRTYSDISGTKKYSSWSKAKTVTTK